MLPSLEPLDASHIRDAHVAYLTGYPPFLVTESLPAGRAALLMIDTPRTTDVPLTVTAEDRARDHVLMSELNRVLGLQFSHRHGVRRADLTQRDRAKAADVTPGYIASPDVLTRIAKALGVPVRELQG